MSDWTASMQQTYEYYTVDPGTWRDVKAVDTVTNSTVSRDSTADTLGSATIDIADSIGECYIRQYLKTIQNGVTEKHPLGTFLLQTPSTEFDGKMAKVSVDAYTPLLELKENQPPIGYYLAKGDNIMEKAYQLIREHSRAPVVKTDCDKTLHADFVANTNDTWLTYIKDLIANANYELGLDELSRTIFLPKQELAALQPVWTYTDDVNSSILLPEMSSEHDLFDVPNVVEVLYSSGKDTYYAKVVNDDPNSPVSTVSRGRLITYRDTNPALNGEPNEAQIQEYARRLLKALSTLEYNISYTHGYCPVRVGDCVRINCEKAGLLNIKAKVISQNIKCEPGCPVSEKAVYTVQLWG